MAILFWKNKTDKKLQNAKQMTTADYEKLGRSLEQVYLSGYASTSRLITVSILRGIGYGFGIFIGGTIVVAILIWFIGQFEAVQFLEPIVNNVLEIVNQQPTSVNN
jgi:hypothetical protein